jgi:hypothetical protein
MAHVAPTLADFAQRFPTLDAEHDDEAIGALLAEALRYVDDSWREADYADAALYLTAHWLTAEKSAEQSSGQPGEIASESFGPLSVSYARATGTDAASLKTTHYGKQFDRLRRGNFPSIVVV